MTKVGGQRRAFYERDPVLVDTILSYDVDSEYKEIQRKRPFLGPLYCQNLFKQILRFWACAHLRPLLHLVDRKILAREGHYTKRLKLSVRIGAWVCRDQCTPKILADILWISRTLINSWQIKLIRIFVILVWYNF